MTSKISDYTAEIRTLCDVIDGKVISTVYHHHPQRLIPDLDDVVELLKTALKAEFDN